MSDDTISRQAAIDAVKKLSLGETDATRLAMRIGDYLERLPSTQPEQRWIPISEKLPEPDVDVLLQLTDMMAVGYYFYDGWHVYFSPKRKDVIAWRELPEPYKEEQE